MTRRRTTSLAALLAALVALAGIQAGTVLAQPGGGGPKILEFDTMVGLPATLTGAAGLIRDVNAAGAPWTLTAAKGELSSTGHLEIEVDGLVLTNTGSNPQANFGATVSCLTNTGAAVKVTTGNFPATTGLASAGGGDAKVEIDLSLPHPCIAPIVFVTSAGGNWFAVTGG